MHAARLSAAGGAVMACVIGLVLLGACTSSTAPGRSTTSARQPAPASPVAVRGELQMKATDDVYTLGRPCRGDISFGYGQRHVGLPRELIVHADGPYGSRAVTGHYGAARIVYRHRPGIDFYTCAAAFSVRVPGNYTSLQFQPAGAARTTWVCTVQRADVAGPLALDGSPACLTAPYVVATPSASPRPSR